MKNDEFILNISMQVAESELEDWKTWIRSDYLPALRHHDLVQSVEWHRVVSRHLENPTYALHLRFANPRDLQQFVGPKGSLILALPSQRYGEKCLTFQTIVQVLPD